MEKIIDKLIQMNRFEEEKGLSLEDIRVLNENSGNNIPEFFISYLKVFGFNDNLFGSF
jgi:hypothetical protein